MNETLQISTQCVREGEMRIPQNYFLGLYIFSQLSAQLSLMASKTSIIIICTLQYMGMHVYII